MTKFSYKAGVFLFGLILASVSCRNGDKQVQITKAAEILPEDIVELRADQIKLANIELGAVEMHALGNILKVNGTVSVAPQNQATVSMPLGGFIKSTTLFPGNSVSKGQTLAVIENQDFIDIQQNYLQAKNKLLFAEKSQRAQQNQILNVIPIYLKTTFIPSKTFNRLQWNIKT